MIPSLRAAAEFDRVRVVGSRGTSGPLTVHGAAASDLRVAFAIGKHVGSAVVRNRLRRRLREVLRHLDDNHLVPGHYVISARPAATSATFLELQEYLVHALQLCAQQQGVPRQEHVGPTR